MYFWLGTERLVASVALASFLVYVAHKKFFSDRSSRSTRRLKLDKKKASPLAADSRQLPPAPLQTDSKEREKILKRAFSRDVAEEKWDVIVIGSGIGGLSAAALLAKAGLKVLVLEKHGKLGGACHIFKAEGYEFDVGIHYIGQFNRPTLTKTLLDQISRGQIQWHSMDTCFDVVIADALSPRQRKFTIPSGRGQWREQLKEKFPEEGAAIDRFFDMVHRVNQHSWTFMAVKMLPIWLVTVLDSVGIIRLFSNYFKFGAKSLKEVAESLTENQDLRLLFSYCWGDYGTAPSASSFALQAMLVGHYEHGASYPVGGASEIPYQIIPVIESFGGRVVGKAPVLEILSERGNVTGVRVGVGKDHCDLHASAVISDAGIHNTLLKLLPEVVARQSPCYQLAKTAQPGIGCLSVFIGLKGTAQELGLKAQNVWAFGDNDPEKVFSTFKDLELDQVIDRDYPVLFIGFPSAKDPTWDERYPGRSTVTVVTFAPYRWFQQWSSQKVKKRDDDYMVNKNALGHQIVDQVCRLFPNIKNAVDHVVTGTPVTNEHYLAAHEGAIYGLDHTKERFQPAMASKLRPDIGIPGLYLTGQDLMSSGFVAALYGGLMCASSVLDRNLFVDLVALHKKTKNLP